MASTIGVGRASFSGRSPWPQGCGADGGVAPNEGTFLERSPEVGPAGVSLMQAAFICVAHCWMRWMT